MVEPQETNQKPIIPITKIFLVVWIGAVVFVYIVIYWPPIIWLLAEGLGIRSFIQNLQMLLQPFFTAPYAPG